MVFFDLGRKTQDYETRKRETLRRKDLCRPLDGLSSLRDFSETVAFLDVEVYHITKDVTHINNRCFKKRFKGRDFL